MDLFENELPRGKAEPPLSVFADGENMDPTQRPLADRMRPQVLEDYVGQEELAGPGSLLRRMIEADELRSLILWGPPGSGKTTLAYIVAQMTRSSYLSLSAVAAGMADIKKVVSRARETLREKGGRVILFVDEIHRFNRVQQDALLPHVEAGLVTLIGATTENPSFSVISPLLSRCRVFSLQPLNAEALTRIIHRALRDKERGLGDLDIEVEEGVIAMMARLADGDARRALNLLEMALCAVKPDSEGAYHIEPDTVKEIAQRRQWVYDAGGEQHYNLISALHKSLRGSDPQAAVYWMVRMLEGGEDPLFLLRRMIVFAAEDIGNADPQALQLAVATKAAFESIGRPEGDIPLAQLVTYLATAPKSNSSYMALNRARKEVKESGSLPVPFVIRNAPTGLMKEMGYGDGYQYDHDHPDHFVPQEYLPEEAKEKHFYEPGDFGFEREIKKRMAWWDEKREAAGLPPRLKKDD